MPIFPIPSYNTKWPFSNPHFHQLYQVLRLRKTGTVGFKKPLFGNDGLEYDVEFYIDPENNKRTLVAILHGLAANSNVAHVQGMLKYFIRQGWDAAGLNLPGCSRSIYPSKRRYHFADTTVLEHFIPWVEQQGRWDAVYIIGFSLGGSILIHYLSRSDIPDIVKGGSSISTSLDAAEFYEKIHEKQNRIYEKAFIVGLGWKEFFTNKFPTIRKLIHTNTLFEFDRYFTLPGTTFSSMEEYLQRVSAGPKLAAVKRPLILLNAQDDTFLGPLCFPSDAEINNPLVHTAYPQSGSHCGFKESLLSDRHFSEEIAYRFFSELTKDAP